jgi:hypothetical protein
MFDFFGTAMMTRRDATYRSRHAGTRKAHIALALAMALLPLWSSLAIALDFHEDLATRLNCAVCKSAADLDSAVHQAEACLVPQESVRYAVTFEPAPAIPRKCILPVTTRPPPAA